MLSPSRILEKIIPRLFHPHSFKISVNKVLREQVVNGYTEILGGGHLTGEALIKIQIRVVKSLNHRVLHAAIQVGQVADHSGNRINLPAYRYLYDVVMAVAMGIAALSVHGAILFLVVSLGIQTMRGAYCISAR
jgi:hypothetical protein